MNKIFSGTLALILTIVAMATSTIIEGADIFSYEAAMFFMVSFIYWETLSKKEKK